MTIVNAYYLRHHMYSLVPRHVREDMAWMADTGATAVSLAILEQDLKASRYNLDILCHEAERAGLRVFATMARWGGLVAGAPKAPSSFTATHPETWILDADGRPVYQSPQGPMSSVHHPATFAFFRDTLEALLRGWPIRGITWDEPKVLQQRDFSPAARAALPADAPVERHVDAFADFVERVNLHARSVRPDLVISMFLYAVLEGYPLERCARIPTLDYIGCDGRPWTLADGERLEGRAKALLGQAERFIAAAEKNGKGGLILIENHDMSSAHFDVMDARLPEVLRLGAKHVLYYYYPRNVDDPDRGMLILARHLRNAFKTKRP